MNYNGLPDSSTSTNAMVMANNASGTLAGVSFPETLGNSFLSQMRCAGIAVQYQPNFPNGALQTTNGYQPLVIMTDRDGIETNLSNTSFSSLQNQVHGVKIRNFYRPWKVYHKALRYPLYNRIPTAPSAIQSSPNYNIWGQWHGTQSDIGHINAEYGCQLMIIGRPLDTTEFPAQTVVGTFIVTAYLQYKDRN